MRRSALISVLAAAFVAAGGGETAAAPGPGTDQVAEAASLWQQMRRADVASAEFKAARWRLKALVGTMPATKRAAALAAMMDRDAEPGVNAAALAEFGRDPLPVTDAQRILWDSQRSFSQRELLKTYYSHCRAEVVTSALSDATQRQLVDMLAERVDNLAGTRIHYGEQRLLVHLASAVLSRFGRSGQQGAGLVRALRKYADKADGADGFGAAIPAWLDMLSSRRTVIESFGTATLALGHWEPLVRLKAAAYLGEHVPNDDKGAQVVLSLLRDPRDEVRAAAAQVFAFAKDYRPEEVVPKMIAALTHGRGVIVQAAAAKVLVGRADQASGQVGLLLRTLTDPSRRLGRKRTSYILRVQAALVKGASAEQKQLLLRLAELRLTTSPDGALSLIQALGPDAAPAAPAVRQYRAAADRFVRDRIDHFVLPAILPRAPAPETP